jgi:hypothetical protein
MVTLVYTYNGDGLRVARSADDQSTTYLDLAIQTEYNWIF